jgi:hypothetical protein
VVLLGKQLPHANLHATVQLLGGKAGDGGLYNRQAGP